MSGRTSIARGAVALCLLAAACPPALAKSPSAPAPVADDPELDCRRGFERLVADAQGLPDSQELPVPAGSLMRAVASGPMVHSFTTPGHAAHPMIVRRDVFQRDGAVMVGLTACGYGDKAASDALVEDFKRLTEQAGPGE